MREPRERSCGVRWEEGRRGPRLCPQTEPMAFVTGTTPRAPETGAGGGGCPGAVRSGRRDRAGSPGDGSARGTHPQAAAGPRSPRPAVWRETAAGASSAPASCAEPSGVLRPRGQWREGKKGLRNLAEALNGVGRRGEGLAAAAGGGGRSAAAGGGSEALESAAQALQQSPERGRRRRRGRGTTRPTPAVASRPPLRSEERARRGRSGAGASAEQA